MNEPAYLVLGDGTLFRGTAFGATATGEGEVVFHTGMTGYQEVLTDPSYAGQIVCMTYPEIGNTGCNPEDEESRGIFLRGFVVRSYNERPSSWRSRETLHAYLLRHRVPGISGIDTRALVRHLRTVGALNGVLAHGSQDEAALNAVAVVSRSLTPNASVGDTFEIQGKPFTIVGLGSGGSAQNVVLVPFRTAQIRLFGANALDNIYLQVGSASQVQSVTGQVEALLRLRHNLPAGQGDDFTISGMPLDTDPAVPAAITGTRILRVIQQFDCSAKNICPEDRS